MKKGFTILEALVVITILGILMVSGYPIFSKTLRDIRIKSASRSVVSALKVTRSFAISKGEDCDVMIDFVNDTVWYYEIFESRDLSVKVPHKIASGIDLRDENNSNGSDLSIVFNAVGTVNDIPGTITIKVVDNTKVINVKLLTVNGRVKVE